MNQAKLKEGTVGVIMGGLSAEREVSLETGNSVAEALRKKGYRVVCIDADRQICSRLENIKPTAVFIALHGRFGEDGCIQGLLESVGIPYTGSGVLASALSMDKVQSKRLFEIAKIPTAEWCYPATEEAVLQLGLPVVIKPRGEGSSVGVTIVRERDQLSPALSQAGGPPGALAERYIAGREIAVAVLGFEDDARCLGSVEIRPAEGHYDYEAKYKRDDTQYLVPPPIPEETRRQLEAKTLEVHRLFGCAGTTRTDYIWDEANPPQILELNSIPGMTSHSLLPMIAQHAGLSYEDLAEAILLDADLRA